jgi:hypothetical protein
MFAPNVLYAQWMFYFARAELELALSLGTPQLKASDAFEHVAPQEHGRVMANSAKASHLIGRRHVPSWNSVKRRY